MRKILIFISVFVLLVTGMYTNTTPNVSFANEDKCITGKDITDKITPNLDMYIFGLDLGTYFNTGQVKMIRQPDDTIIQQYHYVITDFASNLDNSTKEYKKGDYFVLNLPKGARVGGLLHKESALVNDIKVTNPQTGEEKVFAEARYDFNTNTVYYVLTDYIEDKENVNFGSGVEWTVAEDYALYNKPYTFTSKFGSHEVTKEFSNHRDANDGSRTLPTTVVYVNPKDNYRYEQVAVHTVSDNQQRTGFKVKYNSPSATPFANDGVFKVYEVPDGYPIPDSYYVDRTQLTDITDQLVKTSENGTVAYTIPTPSAKKYIYYLLNRYTPEQDLVTGFEILDINNNEPLSLTQNQGAGSEQRILAAQLNTYAESTKGSPSICKVYGNISITKVDSSDNSKTLEGAVFSLFNKETGVEVSQAITDKNGVALFKSIEKGTYILKESKAPAGYDLSKEEREVVISNQNQTINLGEYKNTKTPVVNNKIPPKKTPNISTRKVLANTGLSSLEYSLFLIVAFATIGVCMRRKNM